MYLNEIFTRSCLANFYKDFHTKNFIIEVHEVTPLQQKNAPLPHSHQVEAALESDAAAQDLIQRVTQELGEKVTVLK